MQVLLSKYVWVERVGVFIATLAVSLGWADSSQETVIAAGGSAGVIALIQVLTAIVTHARTDAKHALDTATAAGKAVK